MALESPQLDFARHTAAAMPAWASEAPLFASALQLGAISLVSFPASYGTVGCFVIELTLLVFGAG